jgi:hypothetical protein
MPISNIICGYWNLISASISWIMICLGWYVINKHATAGEMRKEFHLHIEKFCNSVNTLLDSCRRYYLSNENENNIAIELDIQTQLEMLNELIEHFEQQQSVSTSKIYKQFTSLYEAVTDGDFGSQRLKSGQEQVEKYKRIKVNAHNLIREARELFCEKYDC